MAEGGEGLKVGEGEVRLFARRLADVGGQMGMCGALLAVSVEVGDQGLRGAVLAAAREIGEEGVRSSEAFGRRPEYFPAGLVESVRMLESLGDFERTVGRWADAGVHARLAWYERDVRPHEERLRGLVREHAALFGYHDGDNELESVVVLVERLTRSRELVEALTAR